MCATENGDDNGDGGRDLSDAIYKLTFLFQGGLAPVPFCVTAGPKADGCAEENGDDNGDGGRDLSDAIYKLTFLFQGGLAPVPPCPTVGEQEICNDNIDNDGDTDTDCDDSDCDANPSCQGAPEICDNMTDDDLDGATDCDDSDCLFDPSCPQPDPSELPATGVTICYDETGQPLPGGCAGTGQDGEYQTGCALAGAARFVRNVGPDGMEDAVNQPVDDTITDMCTGLEWQWQRQDVNGNGTIRDGRFGPDGDADDPSTPDINEGDNLPWCEAVAYANDDLNQGGGFAEKTGWRYPNVRELFSLLLYGNTDPLPAGNNLVDPIFGTAGNGFQGECSSTVHVGDRAYCVNFDRPGFISGVGGGALKLNFASGIRAVRTTDPTP
jgi:hypothetical protein